MNRMRLFSVSLLFLSALGLSRCAGPEPKGASQSVSVPETAQSGKALDVYYAANRQGEIEPCGCQVNQLGGLHRYKAYHDKKRSERAGVPAVFLDAGDTFFASNTIVERRREQEVDRARTLAKALKVLKLAVLSPGDRDFAAGLDLLRELETSSGAQFVSSNLVDAATNKALFPPSALLDVQGVKVGVVGIASVEAMRAITAVKVLPAVPAAKKAIADVRSQGAERVVLLSHSGLEDDRELAKQLGVDLIIGAHSVDVLAKPEKVGATLIVQPNIQGQQAGFLGLGANVSHELVELDSSWNTKNEMTALMDAHREVVRKIALKEGESSHAPASGSDRPFRAHAQECRMCHQAQYDFWANTKHSSAYMVLYAKNQHFDPECISCHTLGFEQPGGFDKISQPIVLNGAKPKAPFVETFMKTVFKADTKKGALDSRIDAERHKKLHKNYWKELSKLEDNEKIARNYLGVQCEHCHGNRNGHPDPKVPTLKKVNETSCKSCHTPPHAKPYDPTTFEKVACPLAFKKAE